MVGVFFALAILWVFSAVELVGAVGRLPRESGKQYTIPTLFLNQTERLKRTIRQRPLLWLQL